MEYSVGLPQRYEVLSELGSGGMGVVYRARDHYLDRIVAIKLLSSSELNEEHVTRFQREAQAAGRLRHDNLVTVLDFGISKHGNPYLVMEFVQGRTLKDLLEQEETLDLYTVMFIFSRLAQAMAHAHDNGVIHRDLKPANIVLIESEDEIEDIKIVDFGIALLLQDDSSRLTQNNAVLGSPHYISPDQIDNDAIDERADIYSLGCIMHECLTGEPPFRGDTALDTLKMHVSSPAPTLNDSLGQDFYTDQVNTLVLACLQKSPADRFQSMEALAGALQLVADNQPNQADVNIEISPANRKSTRDRKVRPIAIAAFAILMMLCMGWQFKEHIVGARQPAPVTAPSKASLYEAGELQQSLIDRKPLMDDELPAIADKVEQTGELDLRNRRIPSSILKELATLKIHNADFRDAIFESNEDLESLANCGIEVICLDGTNFNDRGARAISAFPALRVVEANYSKITDKGIDHLCKLQNIYWLELQNSKLSNRNLESLSKSKALKRLKIADCETVTNAGIEHLKKLKTLKTLDLSGCKNITSTCIIELKQSLPNLDISTGNTASVLSNLVAQEKWRIKDRNGVITLKCSSVSDSDFAKLKLEKKVHFLSIEGNSSFTGDGLKYLIGQPLVRITIVGTNFDDDGALQLANFPRLNDLLLINCGKLSVKGIARVSKIHRIKRLSLRVMKLPPESVRHIAEMENLTTLDLGFSRPLLDDDLDSIAKMPGLRRLLLSGTSIGDRQIKAIAHMPLENLSIHQTEVTDEGLTELARMKTLRRLKLSTENGITENGLRKFRRLRPQVVIQGGPPERLKRIMPYFSSLNPLQ